MTQEPIDKTSVDYFMNQMTQEEFEEICKFRFPRHDFETGMSKKDRYELNMINHKRIFGDDPRTD